VRILVLNPGSSTLKATLLAPPDRAPLGSTTVELGVDATASGDPGPAVRAAIDAVVGGSPASAVDAVAYRVVHGGARYTSAVTVDDEVVATIDALAELAPLHNGVAARVIRAARSRLPDVPHVAAFDTAFHAGLPVEGYRYPVPAAWFEQWGIRRFGFHGLSVAWSSRRAAELLGRPVGELQIVVAHLGSGCSVTAVDGGRSVDTSMGMTPLEGLMMGTRAGSIDPGVLLRLLESGRLDLGALVEVLDHGSGLAGVSGRTSDVRELLRLEADGDPDATLALGLFVRRAAQGIAAAATSLRTVDAVVFTGGIGEHAAAIRSRIAKRLAVLGIGELPAADEAGGDTDAVLAAGPPDILRVAAREDLVIAEAAAELLRDH
jgi:acetate kinase